MHAGRLCAYLGLIAAFVLVAIPIRTVRADELAPQPAAPAVKSAKQQASKGGDASSPSIRPSAFHEPRHATRSATSWRQRQYEVAAARFPAFCQKWGHLLQQRHVNDASHIKWKLKNGWETGTYTGYSNIKTCTCKESEGFAIGKLTYDENTYYVAGKTKDDAMHAKPQLTTITTTTELFRWEHGKWFSF
jgi:hypothetical protein